LIHRLAAQADIVRGEFRPGVWTNLVGRWSRPVKVNPLLVMLSISRLRQNGRSAAGGALCRRCCCTAKADLIARQAEMSGASQADTPSFAMADSVTVRCTALSQILVPPCARLDRPAKGQHIRPCMLDAAFTQPCMPFRASTTLAKAPEDLVWKRQKNARFYHRRYEIAMDHVVQAKDDLKDPNT